MAAANPLLWFVMLCLATSCSTPQTSTRPSPKAPIVLASGQKPTLSAPAAKIASPIRRVVQQMQVDQEGAESAAGQPAGTPSDQWVRVDEQGRIQADIAVTHIDAEVISQLRVAHVQVDKTATHRMIQGWIPFDRVEQVAEMAFVREIRPPRYAMRR